MMRTETKPGPNPITTEDHTPNGPAVSTLGARLVAARGDRSVEMMAVACGLSAKTIRRYELGERDPDTETVAAICAATGCDPNWLLTGVGQGPSARTAEASSSPTGVQGGGR